MMESSGLSWDVQLLPCLYYSTLFLLPLSILILTILRRFSAANLPWGCKRTENVMKVVVYECHSSYS